MRSLSRRDFLHSSAAAGGLLATAAAVGTPSALADDKTSKAKANTDTLRVAVVGVHGRGMDHLHGFAGNGKHNTVVTTVCDCDEGVIGKAMKDVEKAQGDLPNY